MKIGPAQELLSNSVNVLHLGIGNLVEGMLSQTNLNGHCRISSFIPPARGDSDMVVALAKLMRPNTRKQILADNQLALQWIVNSKPCLTGMKKARDVVPDMESNLFLHSGPPIEWDQMEAPMRGAAIAGAIYEGLASTVKEAITKLQKGAIRFEPAQSHQAACPIFTIITPNMPVWIVEEGYAHTRTSTGASTGAGDAHAPLVAFTPVCCMENINVNWSTVRETANPQIDPKVLNRLDFIGEIILPVMSKGLERYTEDNGPINLARITAQALVMGDDIHCRQTAANLLFLKTVAPSLIQSWSNRNQLFQTLSFLSADNGYFIGLATAMAKCMLMGATADTPSSTLLSAMGSNGREFGIQVGAMPNKWFTVTTDDFPMAGDDFLLEAVGLGAFAITAAPVMAEVIKLHEYEPETLIEEMERITCGTHGRWPIHGMGGMKGVPTGIDIVKVAELNLIPRLLYPGNQIAGRGCRLPTTSRTSTGSPPQQKTEQLMWQPSLKLLPWECIKNCLTGLNEHVMK